MKIIITKLYDVFGKKVKSDCKTDVLEISCESLEIGKGYFRLFDNNRQSFVGELKLDHFNYSYEIISD
jgi:hypothetical protein